MPSRNRHRDEDHRDGGDLCAVFVHAGAGFHSYANEKIHLAACQDACKVAMTVLKNGGQAVDAVEMAIKIMEDREITNSGYGSNLAMNGDVECDATIVDHFGRSGAVGAVGHIKNPISLARLVLEHSARPLTLQRVPPNLLVGDGAVDFAYKHHMPVLPNEYLVSPGANERWLRWKQDLQAVEAEALEKTPTQPVASFEHISPPISPISGRNVSTPFSPSSRAAIGKSLRPLTESASDAVLTDSDSAANTFASRLSDPPPTYTPPSHDPLIDGTQGSYGRTPATFSSATDPQIGFTPKRVRLNHDRNKYAGPAATGDSACDLDSSHQPTSADLMKERFHNVDTVGAIAIDCYGNIAAGSSSGGIGMKHKGRTGPAALVGIGTTVIPVDPEDDSRTSVATVTSGTGEHMATSMAAATCSERIYSRVRRKRGGGLEYATEEEAMRTMIEKEFMDHPGVRNSSCAGAIGIMSVKKTVDGIFLYFAHNTDSFAIASMHSDEKRPVSVMSRSTGGGAIAQGGRAARHRKR